MRRAVFIIAAPDYAPTRLCIAAWPSNRTEWPGPLLDGARAEVAAMLHAIARVPGAEQLVLLTSDDEAEADARARLANAPVTYWRERYGDIWLRDTGPVLVSSPHGPRAQCFGHNGWGGKFDFDDDHGLAGRIAARLKIDQAECPWILEGGAIDIDDRGTALVTEQCLLADNRNPGMDRAAIESALRRDLGIRKVIWLGTGLAGDHTDGHVDNLARVIAPGRVACMVADSTSDPNTESLSAALEILKSSHDADERPLEIIELPSVGCIADDDGSPLPASYMNFYIGNGVVVVPTYGTHDDRALAVLSQHFDRNVVGIRADHLLRGGGAFHCITNQQSEQGSR